MRRFCFIFFLCFFIAALVALYYDVKIEKQREAERLSYLCNHVYERGTEDYDRNCLPWWEYLSRPKPPRDLRIED